MMRPFAQNNVFGDGMLASRYAYDGSGRLQYVGQALPGQAEAAAVWQIALYEYDTSNNVIARKYAGGNADFVWQWSERASYSYS